MKARAGDSVRKMNLQLGYLFNPASFIAFINERAFMRSHDWEWSPHYLGQHVCAPTMVSISYKNSKDRMSQCCSFLDLGKNWPLLQVCFLHLKYMRCKIFYWLSSTKGRVSLFARRPNVFRINVQCAFVISILCLLKADIRADEEDCYIYTASAAFCCQSHRSHRSPFKVHKKMSTVSTIAIPCLVYFYFFLDHVLIRSLFRPNFSQVGAMMVHRQSSISSAGARPPHSV